MNEAKLGKILENAARLAGRQVGTLGVPDNWKALAELALMSGVRALAAERFPMMQRVEFRRYRPTYSGSAGYSVGQEVWYAGGDAPAAQELTGHYYRKTATGSGAPGTSGSGWTQLEAKDVWAFINWDQPWETTGIDRAGVDIREFAYEKDPKYYPKATPLKVVGLYEFGIELEAGAPDGVFVKFVPVYPPISFTDWVTGTAYEAGDVVYRSATKDVYECVADVPAASRATAPEDDDDGYWQPVRIAADFETYLTRLVASDLMTEDQGKYAQRATAESELETLRERFHEGNGETRVRTGRFC